MSAAIAQIERELAEVKARIERLEASIAEPLSAERRIRIREIADATARGDRGPLKAWNRQMKKELGE